MLHTSNGFRFGVVERCYLAAEHGTASDDRVKHSGDTHVNAELCSAAGLEGSVKTLGGLADQFAVLRILERHVFGRRDLRRCCSQAAVTGASLGSRVDYGAVLSLAGRFIYAPFLRRGFDEHLPRGSSSLRQRLPGGTDAHAAAGPLHAENGVEIGFVGGGELGANFLPVAFEFFGEEHGEGGNYALTHFRFIDDQRYGVIRSNADPGIGGKCACSYRGQLG